MRLFLLSVLPATACAALLPAAGCNSSSASPPDAGACVAIDASLTASLAAGGSGACNACIQMRCPTQVAKCSADCTCNDPAEQALSCIEGLAASATIAGETSCIAPLANSSDTVLTDLGSCLLTECSAACGATPSDSGVTCDAISTSLNALLEAGSGGSCQSCLQGSCAASVASCANNCSCNAVAVTALECLADLGDAASIASASSCVAPLTASAIGDPALLSVGECLLDSCSSACGTSPEAGPEASTDGEAGPPPCSTAGAKVTVTDYGGLTQSSNPQEITAGPDGNIWFTEYGSPNKIGKMSTAGVLLAEYTIPTSSSNPQGITAGPDGNLWFAERAGNKIGRITPAGVITEYPIPTSNAGAHGITTGPDGNLWFTENGSDRIGKVTLGGTITVVDYAILSSGAGPESITTGPDGNLWFAEHGSNAIGRSSTSGTLLNEFPINEANATPQGIVPGPDGNLWFTEQYGNIIGRITTAGVISQYPTPNTDSNPQGIVVGADGNLWFVEVIGNNVGRINPSTLAIDEFSVPTAGSFPAFIAAGPDGNLWFTEFEGDKIGRATAPHCNVGSSDGGPDSGGSTPTGPSDGGGGD